MQKAQIIDCFLLPPDQQTPEPVHPRVRALHHPPTRLVARLLLDGLHLLAPRAKMEGEAELGSQLAYRVVVISRTGS